MLLQPYISLPMSRYRFRKRRKREASQSESVSYRDRAAYALDAQLASLAAAGDDSAFTTIVTRYQPAVFRWALIFAADPDVAGGWRFLRRRSHCATSTLPILAGV